MNIAVDLDGVLFDTEFWFMTYASLFNLDVKGGKVTNKDGFRVQDRYNWKKEEIKKYIEKYSFQIEEQAPVMPFAKEVLRVLSKNNKIFVITGRGFWHKGEEEITLKRLKKEKIKIEKIEFNHNSKIEACKRYNIDLMIDDYPQVVSELAESGIKCLYFKDLTNESVKHKNVTEVRNWGEIAVELIKLGIIERSELNINL